MIDNIKCIKYKVYEKYLFEVRYLCGDFLGLFLYYSIGIIFLSSCVLKMCVNDCKVVKEYF